MRISQEADYAIRVVLYLSQLEYGEIVGAKTIADNEAISLRFLLKLLPKLIKSGIIQSFRGIKGGYALAKPPEQINLKAVIEAIDGPICMNRCLYDPEYCNKHYTAHCKAHQVLSKVNEVLVAELERINFLSILKQDI
ncbi:MAG TPA: Rrf2 family transcriptional regulator [Methylomusa anaerophila]|uniref:HTH-type transcriptional regulator CymR n=1 Tax=Methylomusa anaerophila TaxID=1930071 RepID=A0A348AGH5_9FIRM|nr:Rrf2 family transcriptional regulator [Methylomusa anaerophila]BBB90173.1 HTH-type transcriptional regulator CymR [Methylomusa anaerophila]HML88101.1 Rrf2 family transcriptional regulator [Methylomusa anaerophila]